MPHDRTLLTTYRFAGLFVVNTKSKNNLFAALIGAKSKLELISLTLIKG